MALYIIPSRYKVRGYTAAECASRNEVLLEREQCFETDTGRSKIGDGRTNYNDLPYVGYGAADLTDLADGDVLVYNATSGLWEPAAGGYTDEDAQDAVAAMIAAGSHSGITFTYDDATNSLDAAVSGGGGGAMVKVGADVAASATQTLTVSTSLAAGETLVLEVSVKDATAGSTTAALILNGDTTATNYWVNLEAVTGSSADVQVKQNAPDCASLDASDVGVGTFRLKRDLNGRTAGTYAWARSNGSALINYVGSWSWTSTSAPTSVSIRCSAASGFAAGSRLDVYKMS